jgi:hypothetical protein
MPCDAHSIPLHKLFKKDLSMFPMQSADEEMSTEQSEYRDLASTSEAAYYLSEKRGFEPGYELEDWLQAESKARN